MITSAKNPRVQQIRELQSRAKARRESNAFVVEGVRLAEEAVAAGWQVQFGLYSPELSERGLSLVAALQGAGVPLEQAAPHVMQAASDTQTPQGILLVLTLVLLPVPEKPDFVLILDQVSDPGNLGTLLRTAAAVGVDAVLLTEGSADAFAPKVMRGAMGAHFRLPVQRLPAEQVLAFCQQHALALWVAAAGEGLPYTQADLSGPVALAVGSEAHGAGTLLHQEARPLHIPMPGGVESLNAAVAGGILMFEVVRQRGLSAPEGSA